MWASSDEFESCGLECNEVEELVNGLSVATVLEGVGAVNVAVGATKWVTEEETVGFDCDIRFGGGAGTIGIVDTGGDDGVEKGMGVVIGAGDVDFRRCK